MTIEKSEDIENQGTKSLVVDGEEVEINQKEGTITFFHTDGTQGVFHLPPEAFTEETLKKLLAHLRSHAKVEKA